MFAARNVMMTGKNPVAFDAVAAGGFTGNSGSNPLTTTWTHTPVGTPAAGLVLASYESTGSTNTMTATWGGISMTSLGKVNAYGSFFSFPNTYYFYVEVFGLLKPPTGAQTISVSQSGSGTKYLGANSVTYLGVQGFGPAATSNSTSGTTSQSGGALTVTSAVNERIVVLLGNNASTSGAGFTAFSGTTRFSRNVALNVSPVMLIGDGLGSGSSTAFTATSSTAANYGAVSVRLLP